MSEIAVSHSESTSINSSKALSFSNSFWGKQDAGVEILLTKLKNSKHNSKQLRSFLSTRVQIEEEYSKKLFKLARVEFEVDYGKLGESLQILLKKINECAKEHQDFGNSLKNKLFLPYSEFIEMQNTKRKEQIAIIDKTNKTKHQKQMLLQKLKTKFFQEKQKCDALSENMSNLYGKEFEKAQNKLEKTESLSNEIKQITAELNNANEKWESDWKNACDVFQHLEEERLTFTKKTLWEFANLVSSVCLRIDECSENIRTSLEEVNTEKEISQFIKSNKTGDEPEFMSHDVSTTQFIMSDFNSKTNEPHTQPPNGNKRSSAALFIKKAFNMSQEKFKSAGSSQLANEDIPGKDLAQNVSQSALPSENNTENIASFHHSGNDPESKQKILSNSISEIANKLQELNEDTTKNTMCSTNSDISERNHLRSKLFSNSKATRIAITNTSSKSRSETNSKDDSSHFYVKVLFPYAKEEEEEMTIVPNQLIKVNHMHKDGWWEGEIVDFESGKILDRGLFPSNFTARIE